MTNWYVGKRIKEDILYNQRAEYGKQVIKKLATRLTVKYGSGWGYGKLKHCVRSAYLFSEDEIGYAVRSQLTWTHLRSLMGVKDELARSFYVEMCRMEHWDTRTLDEKIDCQLYERTAISRKPEDMIRKELNEIKENNQLLPDLIFRSSYFLDMGFLIYSRRKISKWQFFPKYSFSLRKWGQILLSLTVKSGLP